MRSGDRGKEKVTLGSRIVNLSDGMHLHVLHETMRDGQRNGGRRADPSGGCLTHMTRGILISGGQKAFSITETSMAPRIGSSRLEQLVTSGHLAVGGGTSGVTIPGGIDSAATKTCHILYACGPVLH